MRYRDKIIVFVLVMTGVGLVSYRIHALGPFLAWIVPGVHHEFHVDMQLDGHGEDVTARVALPAHTAGQAVGEEMANSTDFAFRLETSGSNRRGVWEGRDVRGRHALHYSSIVRTAGERYELAARIALPGTYPASVQQYLLPADRIQADSPEVRRLLEELVPPAERDNAAEIARRTFTFCQDRIRPVRVRGTTDGLTCLRLGEASCGGKSRLLAALLRCAGVPARIVAGVILKEGTWSSTHVWVDAWIDGKWVPFCPRNGYFAERPAKYLVLWQGDEAIFTHTVDVNFKYSFQAREVFPSSAGAGLGGVVIPLDILKVVLLFPFGALVVVLARTYIGLETFGTFMPALLAVAFRDTGLVWGISLFGVILLAGVAVRAALQSFQLLQTPRLAVLLTTTVVVMLAVSVLAVMTGCVLPTRVSLLPLVVMTMTIERFSSTTEEEGLPRAFGISLWTLLVAVAAYLVMDWRVLQDLVLAFPEILLFAIAGFFLCGRWTGLRLAEYVRFRALLAPRPSTGATGR